VYTVLYIGTSADHGRGGGDGGGRVALGERLRARAGKSLAVDQALLLLSSTFSIPSPRPLMLRREQELGEIALDYLERCLSRRTSRWSAMKLQVHCNPLFSSHCDWAPDKALSRPVILESSST